MAGTVVNLKDVRKLLSSWDDIRPQLANGRHDGFYLTLRNPDGTETVYLGGFYLNDPTQAIKSVMRTSWDAATKGEVPESGPQQSSE